MAEAKQVPRYVIPIEESNGLVLRVVRATNPDPEDVERLTGWRHRNAQAFLTEFEASIERTERWLTGTVSDDSRILFMVCERDGSSIGYIGLANINWETAYGELDAVVRGESGYPGAMTLAALTLLKWASETLGLLQLGVRVLADNPAVPFYSKLGAIEVSRIPLRREEKPDKVEWKPVDQGEIAGSDTRWLVHMRFPPPRSPAKIQDRSASERGKR